MKSLSLGIFFVLMSTVSFSQGKVGIGTKMPSTPLDIASQDNWDLINGEGDVRIGNPTFRLKIGVATGGGGAGSVNIMQYGLPNGYNVLTLGSQGKQVMHINGNTGFAGIGTTSPVSLLQVAGTTTSNQLVLNGNSGAPLTFSNFLGKKINLFSSFAGHVGFGVYGNELRMHTDKSGADITFGYETGGAFTERIRVKGNGAIALNGNAGSDGQVLMSKGADLPATWTNKPTVAFYNQSANFEITGNQTIANIPGMNLQVFYVGQNSKVVFTTTLALSTVMQGTPFAEASIIIKNSFGEIVGNSVYSTRIRDTERQTILFQGITNTLPPDNYTIFSTINRPYTNETALKVHTSWSGCNCQGGKIMLQIIPE